MNTLLRNALPILFLFANFALSAQTFSATVEQPIPDDGSSIAFGIEVSGLPDSINTSFGLVEVCLNMTHTWNSDMDVRLKAPDGTVFLLFAGVGGDGDNWENCCLRGDATEFIYNFGAPFSGVFRPLGNMGNVNNGQDPNGLWQIVLYDTYAFADAGYMKDWSIRFDAGAPGPTVFPGTYLPLVKITTGGQSIPNDPKILADLQIVNKGGGQLNLLSDTIYEYEGDILVELQGFTGPGYPKKNYDFDLVDNGGLKIDTSLLGLPAENDWILKAEYLDPTLMANPMAYEFARRMGRYAPRTMYCELFVDGDYQGVFNLTEKVKRGKDRVDIAKLTFTDVSGEALTGGYIIEMNHNGAPGAWDSDFLPINFSTNNLPVQYKFVYPKTSDILPVQGSYIHAFVDNFEYSLHAPDFADPENGYRKWIDVGSFIDFMLVNEFSTNYDSYGRSTYLFKEKSTDGGLLKVGPAWDYDRGYCCVEGWVWEQTHPVWPYPDWWSIFHSDPAFLQERHCRWQELRETVWTTEAFLQMADSLHLLLGEAVARNFERWPEQPGFVDFDDNVAARKANIAARLDWMDAQINGSDCVVSTAIAEQGRAFWSVFPNPAAGLVRVVVEKTDGPFQIKVHDLHGRERFSGTIPAGKESLQMDVSNWPTGVYVVELRNGSGRWVQKLMVF